ncbi:MAG: GNAT family N-acetyltransferase [Acidobacteriota bacterium]
MPNEALENQSSRKVAIRLATVSDALMLAKSRYAFRSSIGSAHEDEEEFVRRCAPWMQERLREGSPWKCWIGECDQMPAGHLWLQIIEKIPNPTIEPEYHAYLTNFYVHEEARGKGIGSMLLSAALAWSQTHDVHAVILWPTEQSRSLYLRHGFAVRDDLMELIVGAIGGAR